VQLDLPGRIDRSLCDRCGKCAEVCPGRGLRQVGRFYETSQLTEILLRDRPYYQTSGGGVTLSGGEPTLYLDYAAELLQKLKAEGIHSAIETCGFFNWPEFETKVLGGLDLILFDVKLADPERHLEYTGQRNEKILDNLARLLEVSPEKVMVRVPLIPGITAREDNLQALSRLFVAMGIKSCWLLPYNPLGFSKLVTLGKPPIDMPERMLDTAELSQAASFFSQMEMVEM
jgi:pyruvate formate lyase activating enzyme